jgi:quercetin 2,3-dioxygenase
MMTFRRSEERGLAEHGWLTSRHTFSFGDYYDPAHMGFGSLRVVNEDVVRPKTGFGPHPHRDMEILTYVLEGALAHQDSLGNGSTIRPGEVQRMSAGKGVVHSERNPSSEERVHFLQIWVLPSVLGLKPSYEQKAFPEALRRGRLCLIASPDEKEGSLTIHQDARLFGGLFRAGERARHVVLPGRRSFLHLARGELLVNGELLRAGDAAMVEEAATLDLEGISGGDAEGLLFDLA